MPSRFDLNTIFSCLLVASLTLGVPMLAAAEPAGCKEFKELPITLKKRGVYCLTKTVKVNLATGNAIEVTGNDIVVDLSEHAIINKAADNSAVGVYADQKSNVTIRNGTISGFDRGVYVRDFLPHETAVGNLAEDLRVIDSLTSGIAVFGPGSTVRRSHVIGSGPFGIEITGSGARVLNNDVTDVAAEPGAAAAIVMKYSDGGAVRDNRVQNVSSSNAQDTHGILVENSTGAMVRGNDLSNTGTYGIRYFSASGMYMDNQVFGATNPFFGAGDGAGETNHEAD